MDHDGRPTAEQFHSRMRLLHILAAARGRGWEAAVQEGVRLFGSEDQLVLAGYQRWRVHLLARLDAVIEAGTGDPHREVQRAVEELGRTMPGLAALLTAHADDPLVARAVWRLADYVAQACPCGRPHRLLPSAGPQRPTSGCALRRARAMAEGLCRHLSCAGLKADAGSALRA